MRAGPLGPAPEEHTYGPTAGAGEGEGVAVPYSSRRVLDVLHEFRGSATSRGQTEEQRRRLIEFVAQEYTENGRSIRELGELTGRTQTAVRRALDQAGVVRRGRGAPSATLEDRQPPALPG